MNIPRDPVGAAALAGALAEAGVPRLSLTPAEGPGSTRVLASRDTDLPGLLLSATPGTTLADVDGRLTVTVTVAALAVATEDPCLLAALARATPTNF